MFRNVLTKIYKVSQTNTFNKSQIRFYTKQSNNNNNNDNFLTGYLLGFGTCNFFYRI
jgi:hypothetical protein